ncbi:MAG: hypothetical protein MJ237_09770 [bacterium]|nr:hypothetical protein [bacterium]
MLEKINFTYETSDNQDNLFTRVHTRFDVCIETERGEFETEYQCNTLYTEPNKRDVLECLLSDMNCFEGCVDSEDFIFSFGYDGTPEDLRKGFRAYEGCKATAEAMHRIFTDAELEELQNEIEN